jgi:O-antigen ligase
MARRVFPVLAVSVLVAWSLFAFGSVYRWTAWPTMIGAVLLALAEPPRLGGTRPLRRFDASLLLFLAAATMQIVPLPAALRGTLSPHLAAFDARYRVDAGFGVSPDASAARPLSVAPETTVYVLLFAASLVLLFWTCRTLLAGGGARRLARAISWFGLAAALIAIVQRAVSPGLVYGFWSPLERGAQPFGPIINRNHFATWMILALPICLGYLVAHAQSHRSRRPLPFNIVRSLRTADARVLWLWAAAAMMLLAVTLTASRAALLSLAASAGFGVWLRRNRRDLRASWTLGVYVALALIVLLAWANFGAIVLRLDELAAAGPGGRSLIWRDTLAMARDFWLTGVGLGSYQTAMVVYQTATRDYFFNHAHNQYLQLAAEGGLLLVVPAGLALAAFVLAARERLRHDSSPMWNLRLGALTGIVAVAAQSVWECGLITPANGVLLAVAAALLLHRVSPAGETQG